LKIPKIRKLFPYGKFIESRTIDEIPNPYDLRPHDALSLRENPAFYF